MNMKPESLTMGCASILICAHPALDVVNIYANGLPLGILKAGVFTPDPLFARRNPFESVEALQDYVLDLLAKLKAPANDFSK